MAEPPRLQVSSLAGPSPEEANATTSPARGAEMRNFLQARLQKNRAPPLVHSWDFWHDRQDRSQQQSNGTSSQTTYEDRLEVLANVDDVRKFWNVFNNFDITRLQLRDSVHLFHKGVKPVWEDPRNARGGSWTFRVPKAQAAEFWKDVCMLAIGEQLQSCVETNRTTFRDDICGISLSVRFNSMLVQIWNRDGEHEAGIQSILECVVGTLNEELKPREGSFYYKKHSEHSGFMGTAAAVKAQEDDKKESRNSPSGDQGMQSLNAILG